MTLTVAGSPVQAFETWIERRDAGVVRQERDFSCGLAALASLLTYAYGDPTPEEELLRQFQLRHGADGSLGESPGLSFTDLAMLAEERGYTAGGYAVNARHLRAFRVPVLVHLNVAGRSHFSLLRGVSDTGDVWLVDPSWGNRRLAAWEFRRLFQTDGDSEKGRVLLVTPGDIGQRVEPDMALDAHVGVCPFTSPRCCPEPDGPGLL